MSKELPVFQCTYGDETYCSWTPHRYKHFSPSNLKREHTRNDPAKYLSGVSPQEIEVATLSNPGWTRGRDKHFKEYLRDVGEVIGWDEGQEATFSYVECSGGLVGGRTFHGRPMHKRNKLVVSMRGEG